MISPRTPLSLLLVYLAAMYGAPVYFAGHWHGEDGWRGILAGVSMVWLALAIVTVTFATARDRFTERLAGSPEAPECPEWANPSQKRTWAFLHSMDPLIDVPPKLVDTRRIRPR